MTRSSSATSSRAYLPRVSLARMSLAMLLSASLLCDVAYGQSAPMIYPSAGQSMDQQARDENDCRNWATQQTGVYPYAAPPTYYGNPNEGMPVAGGAARGAALGAIGGAIGGDAGKGAAIGAAVGGGVGLMRKNQQRRQQAQMNDQAQAQYQQDMYRYQQAFAACMQGRGYVVR